MHNEDASGLKTEPNILGEEHWSFFVFDTNPIEISKVQRDENVRIIEENSTSTTIQEMVRRAKEKRHASTMIVNDTLRILPEDHYSWSKQVFENLDDDTRASSMGEFPQITYFDVPNVTFADNTNRGPNSVNGKMLAVYIPKNSSQDVIDQVQDVVDAFFDQVEDVTVYSYNSKLDMRQYTMDWELRKEFFDGKEVKTREFEETTSRFTVEKDKPTKFERWKATEFKSPLSGTIYVSEAKARGTNLQYYKKKFKELRMDENLYGFLLEAKLDQLSPKFGEMIKDGVLLKTDVYRLIQTEKLNSYTFDLVNKHFFNNIAISSNAEFLEVQKFIARDYALYRLVKTFAP